MRSILVILAAFAAIGCVSKKKYRAAEVSFERRVDSLHRLLAWRGTRIDRLQMDSARMKGANEALLASQQNFFDRLDRMEAELDLLNSSSDSARQALLQRLEDQKDRSRQLNGQIDAAIELMDDRLRRLRQLTDTLSLRLRAYPVNRWAVDLGRTEAALNLQEDLLFAPGSTTRLTGQGEAVLEALARVFDRYPEFGLDVRGHTDNQPIRRRSLDNWEYSALRAVTVAKALLEFGLQPNQLTATGKSEYEPRQANDTPEGQAQNRRIELRIHFRESDLVRDLRRLLQLPAAER